MPNFIIYLTALLTAITVHEFSHAWMADWLGDPTPRLKGRLKLNPLVHIDPYGLIFLFLFGFGWGKPVPFDPYNLRRPHRDAALISIAGPISNFALALICSIILRLFIFFELGKYFPLSLTPHLLSSVISLNIVLGVFNLLPVHPLDGFKIAGGLLSEEKSRQWYELERYGMIFLLLLILPLTGSSMIDIIIRPIVSFVVNLLIPNSLGGKLI